MRVLLGAGWALKGMDNFDFRARLVRAAGDDRMVAVVRAQ